MGEEEPGRSPEQLAEELRALRAEIEVLRGRLALFRAVTEAIPDAVYVKDALGRYLMINSAGARMLGKSVEEVIGRDDTELFDADAARQVLEADRQAVAAGTTITGELAVTVAGAVRTYLNTKAPYRDDRGRDIGVVGISRDVTEHRRAEDALHEAQEFLVRLLDNAPAPIYVSTRDGRRRLVNRAWEETFQLPREQVIGCLLEQIFPPETARRFGEENRTIIETGTPLALEQSMELPDGRRDFHTVKFPLYNAAGRIEAVGGISLDITERKRSERALREYADRLQALSLRVVGLQEQDRRHVARELHDEIGQALSAVSVNLHAVKDVCDPAAWPRVEESIGIVDRAIQQVRNLSFDMRPAMLDDLGLVATVRWYADRQAQRGGLALSFAAESSGARLPADLDVACFRAVQEALTNVVRHARARHVWIRLRQGDDRVDLTVHDDGVGFDPEAARRRAARGESFGLLGLRERVELLGGRFVIRSRSGRGTSIRVRLPAVPPPSPRGPGRGG